MWNLIDRLTDFLAVRYDQPVIPPPPEDMFRTEYNRDELLLTKEEITVGDLLAEAYNRYMELPRQHPNDQSEFVAAIHAAQHLILYRPGFRQLRNQDLMDALDAVLPVTSRPTAPPPQKK